MVNGNAFIDLTGKSISATSTSQQTIGSEAQEIALYAAKNQMPIALVGLVDGSSHVLGPVYIEATYVSSGTVAGVLPAIGMTVAIAAGKLTFTAIS